MNGNCSYWILFIKLFLQCTKIEAISIHLLAFNMNFEYNLKANYCFVGLITSIRLHKRFIYSTFTNISITNERACQV